MKIAKLYSSILVDDLERAEGWYTSLLGRAPDFRPMSTLIQWELSREAGVMVSTSDEIAAPGAVMFYVDDMDAERQRLREQASPWATILREITRHSLSFMTRTATLSH